MLEAFVAASRSHLEQIFFSKHHYLFLIHDFCIWKFPFADGKFSIIGVAEQLVHCKKLTGEPYNNKFPYMIFSHTGIRCETIMGKEFLWRFCLSFLSTAYKLHPFRCEAVELMPKVIENFLKGVKLLIHLFMPFIQNGFCLIGICLCFSGHFKSVPVDNLF